jgi:hypothetical protein
LRRKDERFDPRNDVKIGRIVTLDARARRKKVGDHAISFCRRCMGQMTTREHE